MKVDVPGVGGSLGECVWCGKAFVLELLTDSPFCMMEVGGFHVRLPFHKTCAEEAHALQGKEWTEFPDGPLRREFESVYAESPAHGPLEGGKGKP